MTNVKDATGAREHLRDTIEGFLTPLGVGSREEPEHRFVAGLVTLLRLGATLKASHDVIYANLPYDRVVGVELKDLRAELEPWGWHYDEDGERFENFFAGG